MFTLEMKLDKLFREVSICHVEVSKFLISKHGYKS